jgi:MEMO1 family protein
MERPRLRNIEAFPVEISDKRLIFLRDPLKYGKDMLVSPALIEIIKYFDGKHSIQDIQYKLMLATGELIDSDLIKKVVSQIDEHLLLDSDNFKEARKTIDAQFANEKVRQPAHAGMSYPADLVELEDLLENFFTSEDGAGKPEPKLFNKEKKVKAIIAPHIDLRVAGSCYSWAYKEMAESASDVDTIVILGTSHYGTGDLFILTEKDFQTPLGLLETDRDFIALLRSEFGRPLNGFESAHRLEHSIEFQTIFIQSIFKNRKPPKIVPILVTSFYPLIDSVDRPDQYQEFALFTSALKRTIEKWGKKLIFVVGADLAHIGRKFGDDFDAETRLKEVKEADLEILKKIESCDANGLFNSIKAVRDCRRVCGFPPILTLLAACDKMEGKLLKYEQWSETATDSAVTYASLVFYQ